MAKRKTLTPWQILVIEQLIERAVEFEQHKYDPASLNALKKLWNGIDKVTVTLK